MFEPPENYSKIGTTEQHGNYYIFKFPSDFDIKSLKELKDTSLVQFEKTHEKMLLVGGDKPSHSYVIVPQVKMSVETVEKEAKKRKERALGGHFEPVGSIAEGRALERAMKRYQSPKKKKSKSHKE